MGRGLLFRRQLPWRGRLSRQGPQTSPTYAVLAILSDSYPPLKGRLPTCYSPVRHFTGGRSPFLVRLACVRPAANVRSEPGSNSPINLKSTHHSEERHDFCYSCFPSFEGPKSFFAIQFSKTDRRGGWLSYIQPPPLGAGAICTPAPARCQFFFSRCSRRPEARGADEVGCNLLGATGSSRGFLAVAT